MAQYCGKCGSRLDSSGRCPNCGLSPAPDSVKKKKRHPILVLIVFLLLALVIACALQLYGVIHVDKLQELLDLTGLSHVQLPGSSASESFGRPSAEEYLSELGAVGEPRPAGRANLLTEEEALRAFAARGFENVTVTACYDTNGTYLGDQEISPSGTDRHPYYEAGYLTPDGVIWTVTLMEDGFYAEPLSYNAAGVWEVSRTVCESGSFLTYDGAANAFFQVTPDPQAMVLKRVDRIDAETLDQLTWEEVAQP